MAAGHAWSSGSTLEPRRPRTRLTPEQIKLLMKQGEQFIAAGEIATARIAFQRAAEAGDANAAVALGATDPTVLAKLGVVGISADVAHEAGIKRAEVGLTGSNTAARSSCRSLIEVGLNSRKIMLVTFAYAAALRLSFLFELQEVPL